MLRRSILSVLGVALALSLGATPALGEDASGQPGPGEPRVAQPSARMLAARAALTEAERALGGDAVVAEVDGGRSLTFVLRDLLAAYDDLGRVERARADRLLARPDDGPRTEGEDALYARGAQPVNDCEVAPTPASRVCVHWARATADRPRQADADRDGVPDYVEHVRDTINQVWERVVDRGGYLPPRSDHASLNHGPDGRLDVYLADLGELGSYGYCTTDDPALERSGRVSAYCVLDNDYAPKQYGRRNTPLDSMRVTATHEFFHAVQFGYDVWEDVWLMEASATWLEDEVFDHIDDNHQYLAHSPLKRPHMGLDYFSFDHSGQYGAWLMLRYLSERFPDDEGTGLPAIVRRIWERAASPRGDQPGEYSMEALANESAAHGAPFPRLMQDFALANRRPGATYREGAAYRKYVAAPGRRITVSKPGRKQRSQRVSQLSSQTWRVTPGGKFAGAKWRLKADVDMPVRDHGLGAVLTVHRKDGAVRTVPVALDAEGRGAVRVPFGGKRIRYVELTLVNGSIRYTCWQGPRDMMLPYSCAGYPKDDYKRVVVGLKPVRR